MTTVPGRVTSVRPHPKAPDIDGNGLCPGLARIGWHVPKPKGTMFVRFLTTEAQVAASPGIGFGPGGEATFGSPSSRTNRGLLRP